MKTLSDTKKYSLLLKSLLFTTFIGSGVLHAHAQNTFEILIPVDPGSSLTQLTETGNVLEQLEAHAKSIKKSSCYEMIKSDIKERLNHEVFYIHNGTPYQLRIDYGTCKMVSLEADLGISSNSATTYTIETYQDVLSATTKTAAIDLTPRHALLATYQENGKWVAIGPYNTTDEPFTTEQEAIKRLFYSAADMNFLCNAGKYRVYTLNKPLEYDARDVKKLIEQDGIDFPDGITDKKPEGFSGWRRSTLIEQYDKKLEAKYLLCTSAKRSVIVAKFTNYSEDKKASVILKPKDGKIVVKTIPPGISTNLVFDGSDFEVQAVYSESTKEEREISIIDFVKGVIRKHVTQEGEKIKSNPSSGPPGSMGVRG